MRRVWRIFAGIVLTTLFGCGDGSVNACFGDAAFCHFAFNPVARPGPDQTVASGDVVTLDGSNSTPSGGIRSYSWAQTGGPTVTLTDANNARATFVAPMVTSSADLSFRLTVVNNANQADSSSTQVTVQPPAAAAVTTALALFESSLQPAYGGCVTGERLAERLSFCNRRSGAGCRCRATRVVVCRALHRDRERHRRRRLERVSSTRRACWWPRATPRAACRRRSNRSG